MHRGFVPVALGAAAVTMLASVGGERTMAARQRNAPSDSAKFLTQPLVEEIYTADPSAHAFGTRLYLYASHDIEAGVPQDDLGSHFAMRDYRAAGRHRERCNGHGDGRRAAGSRCEGCQGSRVRLRGGEGCSQSP